MTLDPFYPCPGCGEKLLTINEAYNHCRATGIPNAGFYISGESSGLTLGDGKDAIQVEDLGKVEMTVLEEATKIVDGPRQDAYGHPKDNYGRLAKMWSVALKKEVTPHQVVLCHMLVKIVREVNEHKRDNLVDIAGYARVMEMLDD